MNLTEAVKSSLSQYAGFTGRARRSEYWFFYLFTILVSLGFNLMVTIDVITGIPLFALIGSIAALALILPTIAVTVRRLHDTGRSGWHIVWWAVLPWVIVTIATLAVGIGTLATTGSDPAGSFLALLGVAGLAVLLPIVGSIVLFVFMVLDSQPGDNKYGPAVKTHSEY